MSSSAAKKPSQILSYLYLGGKVDAKAKEVLQKLKIKYILNCTPQRTVDPENGCPNFYEKERSFVYKRIPIFDNQGEDILAHMETAYKFIEEGKHYGNVLVHCHKGVSRSASFVIGYLMKKNEFTLEEAIAHVQMIRPAVQPNSSFLSQLAKYSPNGTTEVSPPSPKRPQEVVSIGPTIPRPQEVDAVENEDELPPTKKQKRATEEAKTY
jgi:protein-tyrosine phosphatase